MAIVLWGAGKTLMKKRAAEDVVPKAVVHLKAIGSAREAKPLLDRVEAEAGMMEPGRR